MNLEALMGIARRESRDLVAPYLWDDEELIEFFADAELEACRRAHLIVDSSGDVARATVSAGDPMVELDPRVIFVRRARLASQSLPLRPRVASSLDEQAPGWESAMPSTPSLFVPDWEEGALRLYPPPVAADELLLRVVREPMKALADPKDVPEIPARYHRALVQWVLYRMFSKVDAETLDPKRAETAKGNFEAEFGPASRAIDEHWAREQYYEVGDFQ